MPPIPLSSVGGGCGDIVGSSLSNTNTILPQRQKHVIIYHIESRGAHYQSLKELCDTFGEV